LRAKTFLERGNLLADRRLPRSKLAGDRRKATALDDAEKEELPKFPSVTLPVTSSPSTVPLNSSVSGIGVGNRYLPR
jgi:hypothetical protein